MANVHLERPEKEELKDAEKTYTYINRLLDEMEYALENLDEDNLTERFKKKVGISNGMEK